MKLVTFSNNNNLSIGAVKDDLIISFAQSSLPKNMINFIELGNDGLDTANDLIEKGEVKGYDNPAHYESIKIIKEKLISLKKSFESGQSIVAEEINAIDSDNYNKQTLLNIYNEL